MRTIHQAKASAASKDGQLPRDDRHGQRSLAGILLGLAAFAGIGVGFSSTANAGAKHYSISERAAPSASANAMGRSRPPQAGDYWRGCNDARAAGTAPIYAYEPGYRVDMDGDRDGVACEPHR